MDKELKQFIEEGVKRYKEASRLMVLFGETIESELQGILSARKDWGTFNPEKQAIVWVVRDTGANILF